MNPPAAAAREPLSMVSACSNPGSRRCTCISMKPGATIIPVASNTSAFGEERLGATPATRPSTISFRDPKAAPQGLQEPLERLRVVTVAPQDRNVQGQARGVGGYRQDDLGPIAPVIPAVAVSSQVLRALAFEIDAGQIVEHQTDRLGEGALVELLFQAHPVAGELIHRAVNIILIKRLLGLQPAGLGQPGALRLLRQGELGAGKEQAAINGGLEQSALAGRADARKEFSQTKA